MIVVLDTNILLVSISPQSSMHWLYKSFLEKSYSLAVSTEIILEYQEIIGRLMNATVAEATTKAITTASNTILVSRWYNWNLIQIDPDDDKFVDTYVAAGADYIVTEDGHFQVLKNVFFPAVKVIGVEKFKVLLTGK